jgi:predicted nucleic-acid-binding Zn-ribbon protein
MHEQINFALNQLSLCGEEKKLEIDRQTLKFIKNLCRYSPFTDFFRDQPFTVSIDFL